MSTKASMRLSGDEALCIYTGLVRRKLVGHREKSVSVRIITAGPAFSLRDANQVR